MERVGGTGVPGEYLKGGRARLECIPSPPVITAVVVIQSHRQQLSVVRARSHVSKASAGRAYDTCTIPRAVAIRDPNRYKATNAVGTVGDYASI